MKYLLSMEEALRKIIKNLIMPRFPIIRDFAIRNEYPNREKYYFVITYFVKDEENIIPRQSELQRIEDITDNLFMSINDGSSVLYDVVFNVSNR